VDEPAEKLAKQLELAEKTLFALEAYLAQARQVITLTRTALKEAQSGDVPAGPPGGSAGL
jgi:hypothetical protein